MEQTQTTETVDTQADSPLSFEELEQQLHADTHREHGENPKPGDSLNHEDDSSQSEPATDPNLAGADAPETVTVKQLAEKLGVDAADVYNGLSIDLGDGNTVTLGEYKDRAKDLAKSDTLLAQITDQKQQQENELFRQRQALQTQAQRMGIEVSEEVMQEQERDWQQYRELQDRIAVELMPELAETEAKQVADTRKNEFLAELGFSEAEAQYVVDARWRKFIRDHLELRDTVRDVGNKKVRPKQNSSKPNVQTSSKVTKLRQALDQGKATQGATVAELGKLLG